MINMALLDEAIAWMERSLAGTLAPGEPQWVPSPQWGRCEPYGIVHWIAARVGSVERQNATDMNVAVTALGGTYDAQACRVRPQLLGEVLREDNTAHQVRTFRDHLAAEPASTGGAR